MSRWKRILLALVMLIMATAIGESNIKPLYANDDEECTWRQVTRDLFGSSKYVGHFSSFMNWCYDGNDVTDGPEDDGDGWVSGTKEYEPYVRIFGSYTARRVGKREVSDGVYATLVRYDIKVRICPYGDWEEVGIHGIPGDVGEFISKLNLSELFCRKLTYRYIVGFGGDGEIYTND